MHFGDPKNTLLALMKDPQNAFATLFVVYLAFAGIKTVSGLKSSGVALQFFYIACDKSKWVTSLLQLSTSL